MMIVITDYSEIIILRCNKFCRNKAKIIVTYLINNIISVFHSRSGRMRDAK